MYSYDFDNDGKITREDARIILSFLPKRNRGHKKTGLGISKQSSESKSIKISPDNKKKYKVVKGQVVENQLTNSIASNPEQANAIEEGDYKLSEGKQFNISDRIGE